MVTKRGNRIGICTLDDRSGRLEVMLFTDALDKYQQLLEKDRILIVSGQVSFDDFSGGLKMTAREVMDIDEAREKYARGLAISLTDRQIDDQLLNRLRQSLEPHRSGTIPVHLYYQRADAGTTSFAGSLREFSATIISSQASPLAFSFKRYATRLLPSTGRNSKCLRTSSASPIRKAG